MRKTSLVVLSLALCPLLLLPLARTEHIHSRHLDHLDYYERLNYDRGEVHAHHVRIQRSSPFHSPIDPAVVEFNALGKTFRLLLRPNTAPPPSIYLVGKGGTRREPSKEEVPNEMYHGFLENDTASYVHGSLHDGIFDGIIHHGNETYYVEAAWKFFDPLPSSFHSVVYKIGDVRPHLPGGSGQGEGTLCGDESLQDYLKKVQSSAVPLKEGGALRRSVGSRSKRAFPPNGNTVCRLRIDVDSRFFVNVGGSSTVAVNNEIATIFNEVNRIFSGTDFNFDRQADGIRFALVVDIHTSASEPTPAFANDNIAVSDFLDLWSQQDHNDFCLALLLTYRDFDGGVLGLAWVAQPPGGNLGGVCERRARISSGERSLNSAIVTFLNFGRRQTRAVTIVTISHELGHNFGSNHDPNTAACAPGVSGGGNFIMFFSAVDGSQPNNERFSTCSVADIRPVLESSKSSCFIAGENQCGNGLVEGDEPCDCGSDDQAECDMNDICCTTNCTLKPGNECSPMKGGQPCCNDQCMFTAPGMECQMRDDCNTAVMCDGTQATCPVGRNSFRPDGIICNNGNNTCLGGQCSGSVCRLGNLEECLCTAMDQLCDVCCMVNGVCTSTFNLLDTLNISRGVFRTPGRTCNNFLGYCADSAPGAPPVCVGVNNDDFLDILRNLFTEETLNNILVWLQNYWYIPVGIIVVITIVVILLPITYRKKPISKIRQRVNTLRRRVSQRGSQRNRGRNIQEAQTGGVGRNRARGNRREHISNPRRLTESEGVQRVKCFFPHADDDTIRTVMRSKGNESATVKQLLAMGYPIKKQTVDVLPVHT